MSCGEASLSLVMILRRQIAGNFQTLIVRLWLLLAWIIDGAINLDRMEQRGNRSGRQHNQPSITSLSSVFEMGKIVYVSNTHIHTSLVYNRVIGWLINIVVHHASVCWEIFRFKLDDGNVRPDEYTHSCSPPSVVPPNRCLISKLFNVKTHFPIFPFFLLFMDFYGKFSIYVALKKNSIDDHFRLLRQVFPCCCRSAIYFCAIEGENYTHRWDEWEKMSAT